MTANSKMEEAVLAFLTANAPAEVMAKAESDGKTMTQCVAYLRERAKELRQGGETCVMVDHETVFSWAMHWLQDEPAETGKTETTPKGPATPKKAKPKRAKPKREPAAETQKAEPKKAKPARGREPDGQPDFFAELFGGPANG